MMEQIELKSFIDKYNSQNKKPVYINFRSLLNGEIDDFYNSNKSLQYIHPYPGRIAPHIAFSLLTIKDFNNLKGSVLDPFAGSGTILLESIKNSVVKRSAIGIEINPLGRLISKVKTTEYNESKIDEALQKIEKIFGNKKEKFAIVNFINIDLWFSNDAISKLSKLRHSINKVRIRSDYKDFYWVCFAKIVRKVSKADPNIPPPVLLKPKKYKENRESYLRLNRHLKNVEIPDVWELFTKAVNDNKKLTSLYEVKEIKEKIVGAQIISDDAREIKIKKLKGCGKIVKNGGKKLVNNSIDIIFSSPPYLTAQKYIRTTKLELLWLGYSASELNKIEKKTIGTETSHPLKKMPLFELDSIDTLIAYANKKSKKRSIMVYNYFIQMKKVLEELFRVLKNGGYAIFVMGDNIVLKRKVKTYKMISDLAETIGFKEHVIFKDKIKSRSMLTKRNGTGGLINYEYVLILKKD